LLLMFLLASLGCANRDISLRPPKRPEELALPPVADGRFSNPPVYPEPLNQNNDPMRPNTNGPGGPGGGPNLGAMNGMGGMGGMGMGGMGMSGLGGYGGGMGR
jgi:hypothetical protein